MSEVMRGGLGPIADMMLYGYYRERFLPAPHEALALPPAPSALFHGIPVFVGARIKRMDERLRLTEAIVVEIRPGGRFLLSSGEELGGEEAGVVL